MDCVIATSTGLEHNYVANALSKALGEQLTGVLVEDRSGGTKVSSSRLALVRRRYGYVGIAERLTTKAVRRLLRQSQRRERALSEILDDTAGQLAVDCPVKQVPSVNSPDAIDWLRSAPPHVLFVYGTSVLRRRVLSTPRELALNLHTGLSPAYRGSGTVFWPLYNGEPWMVGSTVHTCTAELDGGRIYQRTRVWLDPNDDPYTAFAKCVRDGAAIYAKVAAQLITGEQPAACDQDLRVGREYVFKDLTFVQELVMEWRLRTGALRRLISFGTNHAASDS